MMAMGRLLVALRPGAAQALMDGAEARNRLDQLMLAGLVMKHKRAGTLDRLNHLHKNYWEGELAVAYHEERANRLLTQFMSFHADMLEHLRRVVSSGEFDTLIELGCGSGLLLEYLSSRLPPIKRFIGLDLNAEQTERNQARAASATVRFEVGDMTTWVPEHTRAGQVYLAYGGVLEYLTQEQLETLFSHMGAQVPACIALVEPMGDFDLNRETASRPHGREYSLAHHYPRALEAAGFEVQFSQTCAAGYLRVVAIKK